MLKSTIRQYLQYAWSINIWIYKKYRDIADPIIIEIFNIILFVHEGCLIFLNDITVSKAKIIVPTMLFLTPSVDAYWDVCTTSHPASQIGGTGVIVSIRELAKHTNKRRVKI